MRLSPRFDSALVFAAHLHSDQIRKGSEIRYISHLICVAGIALEYGADEDEAIAALLHDAVEDQGGRPIAEKISRHFGPRVAEIVMGCTDAEVTPKPPWKQRKEAYVAHIRSASPSVRLVSASDKLHNAMTILKDRRSIGDEIFKRFTGGKEGALWYYRALADAFLEVGPHPLSRDLDLVVKELERE